MPDSITRGGGDFVCFLLFPTAFFTPFPTLWFQNSSGCSHKTLQTMSVVVIAAACLGSKPAGYEVLCLLCKRVMQDAATLRAQCQR